MKKNKKTPNPNKQKNPPKKRKNRANKISLVFDADKRRDFLTGFHKRKLQRQKDAKEKFERELKEERKRLKSEAKESYKKLVVSHRAIPELETLLKEEYDDDEVTVKVMELSTNEMAAQNNWIGPNQAVNAENSDESGADDVKDEAEISGMELTLKKKVKEEKVEAKKFDSERDVKRMLKKEATRKVKKSKVFQQKNKMEKQKQKKKSMQMKRQKHKLLDKKHKRPNFANKSK